MSIKIMTAVWEIQSIKGTEKLVLLSLADNANDSGVCWPSLTTIARKCGVTRRQAIRIINELERMGFIEKETRRKTETLNDTNLYRVVTPVSLGDTHDTTVVTPMTPGVVTPVSPKPSIKPSINHKEKRASALAADPRSKSPAVQCTKGITNRYPPLALYDDVIRVLGDEPDGKRAADCYKEWLRRGYNPNSYNWLLEWYVSGIPERNGSKPQARKGGYNPDVFDKFRKEKANAENNR